MSDGAPIVLQFGQAVQEVINRFQNQGITLAEIVGTLECIKMEAITNAFDEEDEAEDGP